MLSMAGDCAGLLVLFWCVEQDEQGAVTRSASRLDQLGASLPLHADIHPSVLNNSYDRIIFEHAQWS